MLFGLYKTDAELDAAYDAARKAGDMPKAAEYSTLIIERIASVSGFVDSLISGTSSFPLFEKWTKLEGLSASARGDVTASATKVGTAIADTVKVGGVVVAIFALAAIGVYAYASSR